ncbi:integrase core domain-containing protein [Mesorhizobium sp. M0276]|uniref:integrase core domain-containing protein n=1 Tax=Mesorhizobium sp. M0276 TaxID=2956928 RepID=UPI00333CB87C
MAARDAGRAGCRQAARAVGVPRSTLYRWESAPEPKSRRPHRVRANGWSPTLRAEVERLRLDFPFWGKDKLGPVLRKAGFAVSNATVGRILKKLVERGRVTPVPELIRKAVLPPRSPKLNGAVERCNGAWRYEFYAAVDLPTQIDKIAQHVDAFQHLYNHHRPQSSRRPHSKRVSQNLPRPDDPAVSYVLSADTSLPVILAGAKLCYGFLHPQQECRSG